MIDPAPRGAGRLFAARAVAAWHEAAQRAGEQRVRYTLAGEPGEVRYAGTGLQHAFGDILQEIPATDNRPARSVLRVFDTASTGVDLPPFPPTTGADAQLPAFDDSEVGITLYPETPACALYDRVSDEGVFWASSADRLPGWQIAAPLRVHFHWVMRSRGGAMIHAAAVGDDTGVVLLPGKGGTGKSTSSLACLLDGMTFLGDDYVALTFQPDMAWRVYSTAKANEQSLRLLRDDRLQPAWHADEGKWVFDLRPLLRGQVTTGVPIRAVVLPSLGDGPPHIERAPAGRALAALAASTVYQSPGRDGTLLATMASLLRQVPAFVAHIGGSPYDAPALVRQVLRETAHG
jgi:hypothetical protein